MTQKTLINIVLLLAVLTATIYGFMIVPPYMAETQKIEERKADIKRETKSLASLKEIRNARIKRTIQWVKNKKLPDSEQRRIVMYEVEEGFKELNTSFSSDYKVPLNPKAFVER